MMAFHDRWCIATADPPKVVKVAGQLQDRLSVEQFGWFARS